MKFASSLAPFVLSAVLVASLAACGSKNEGNVTAAAPVAGKAAPAGTSWTQTVVQTPDGYRMGNPDAPVKLAEYGSYSCSHCAAFAKESHEELSAMVNSGKLSYEYRNFVRDPADLAMVLLARCGGKDVFFPLSEQLFGYQEEMFKKLQGAGDAAYQSAMAAPPSQRFVRLAELAGFIDFVKARGISEDQARQCLSDSTAAEKIAKGVEEATKKYAIQGTPTLLIDGAVVDNVASWEPLRAKLRQSGI